MRAKQSDGVYQEDDNMVAISTTNDANWRIVGVHYMEELRQNQRTQLFTGILISAVCCAVIIWLMVALFSKIIHAPIRQLVRAMQAFEEAADSFTYAPSPQTVAEIQVLNESFSHMVERTKSLMEQVRREEVVLRKTELKALQAQINPHFLYNTLDSIQWMCEQGNNADAVKMVGALAKLFRISISRGKELIPIADEI